MIFETVLGILASRSPEDPAPVKVRELWIPPGDRGARAMVRVMAEEAKKALRNPLTIRASESIMNPELGPSLQVTHLRRWLSGRWIFAPDPYGVELLRTPDYLLSRIREEGKAYGDCDDAATLAAALGLAAGFPARFVLYAFGASLPYSHVFCELYTLCEGWRELDVTRPYQLPPGLQVARAETVEV